MSRLYGKISSDRRKTDATAGANYRMWYKATYGSARNPIIAMKAFVSYHRGEDIPTVVIEIPPCINYQVYVGNELMGDHTVE